MNTSKARKSTAQIVPTVISRFFIFFLSNTQKATTKSG
jgi:hypothetical protein